MAITNLMGSEKSKFIWFFSRFIVTLTASKLLGLGKVQIHLVFLSVYRNFDCVEVTWARKSPNSFGFSLGFS